MFTKKTFFYTIISFIQSYSRVLCNIEGFFHLMGGSKKAKKPINITGIDKINLKWDCINRYIVNGIREPTLYSFALDKPRGQKINKEPRINFLKKLNKSVPSRLTFYLEDDDYKPVKFIGETISCICQLMKIRVFIIE